MVINVTNMTTYYQYQYNFLLIIIRELQIEIFSFIEALIVALGESRRLVNPRFIYEASTDIVESYIH